MPEFHAWDGKIPHDLWQKYNDAYGAVMYGVAWSGSIDSISGVTKDEALEYAADFIKAMATWLTMPEQAFWRALPGYTSEAGADG